MKKLIWLFFLCFMFVFISAKTKEETPDPLYLTTDPLNAEDIEEEIQKPEDPRTLEEKFREKFHLKPSKKIYYHNIDKSNIPITMDDYYEMAADKKRKDFVIPVPNFTTENDIIMPDPHFRVIRYNTPPGQRNIDLSKIIAQRTASSAGILSPDKTKMVYTKCFFYPKFYQTSSGAYLIPVDKNLSDAYEILYMSNVVQGDINPIVSTGMDEIEQNQFKTLFPIDFSKDSRKIALKEKIGSNLEETWQTNIIVYDFSTKKWKRLTAVREAIIYWWRQNKNIDLKDYMWDIFPIGWEKAHPERMVVYAYAFTKNKPLFLGTWSVDYNEEKSSLISIDSTSVEIDLNGFGLKEITLEH